MLRHKRCKYIFQNVDIIYKVLRELEFGIRCDWILVSAVAS